MSEGSLALRHADASIHRIALSELLERLSYFALQTQRIVELGAGPHTAAEGLQQRFSGIQILAAGPTITAAARPSPAGWFRRRAPWRVRAQLRALPLQDGCADLALGHLLLPVHTPIDQALREIARVLRPGGVLLFSSLGPGCDLEVPLAALPDLPDWGELLIGSGFAEPVMDVERHHLVYATAAALGADLRDLGVDAPPIALEATYELITGAAFVGPRRAELEDAGARGEAAIAVTSIRLRKR